MRAGDMTLTDIINRKINFIRNNDIFDPNEFMLYNEGEMHAYNEMLGDLARCDIKEFESKYLKIVKDIDQKFTSSLDRKETERLAGYNNAVVSILTLIDPVNEFDLEG